MGFLSAQHRVLLSVYLHNSHAEKLQEKGVDFLHKLLVQQLNRWLLPFQKIYYSKTIIYQGSTQAPKAAWAEGGKLKKNTKVLVMF